MGYVMGIGGMLTQGMPNALAISGVPKAFLYLTNNLN